MLNTERLKELIADFRDNGINHDVKSNRFPLVLEYQDTIGHASKTELQDFERNLDHQERRYFVWSNNSCLSVDTSIDIIRDTIMHRFKSQIIDEADASIADDYNRIAKKESTFRDCKKAVYKRINSLKRDKNNLSFNNDRLQKRLSDLQTTNSGLLKQVKALSEKAAKYNQLKTLLA